MEASPISPASATSLSQIPSIAVIASSRAVISGRLTSATIVISRTSGKITAVFDVVIPASDFPAGVPYTDYSPHILLPGLVDAHVHLNEPGRTEWEGFYTGTQAAAFGGVTTVIDMPLNAIPPTTTVANFKEKLRAAQGKCWVDVGFYGGIIPGNAGELKALVQEGVRGFKGFLIDSGVDEFPAVSSEDIRKAMAELADEPTTLMFHAEMVPPTTVSEEKDLALGGPEEAYSTFLASRPSSYETCAVEEILSLSHIAPNLPLHIVHLSAMEAIPLLRKARAEGIPITAETCFHYLSLAAEEIRDGDTRHKCCPPIRSQLNQDALWDELERHATDGVIKTIVSDHSPCTPNLKLLPSHVPGHCTPDSDSPVSNEGSFLSAWGGISSVGLGLPILWTEISRRKALKSGDETATKQALQDIVRLCCTNTAAQVGLQHQKGDLVPGHDADICVFDDAAEWVVEPSTMLFRNKCSPYQGRKLRGLVRETWLRGEKVFSHDAGFSSKTPSGGLLLQSRA
ncbi:allantoinase [Aspergillus heteromorphus CBS 117.55]|uniref:allantoinase n=1 Tax=Aspergillus heteromorphus CBS 117.55 TaxID=1448321 RepID=A0A317V614_9EURO|nr:allantoinase [Aspergillus heteromorphus CBS 117.55]PWY69743.1 allantoinase [Aspergillus heteromorphus CBS 117.55]